MSPLVRRPIVVVVAPDPIVRQGLVDVLAADARLRTSRAAFVGLASADEAMSWVRRDVDGVVVVDHPLPGDGTGRLVECVVQRRASWSIVVLDVDDDTDVARAAAQRGAIVRRKRPGARGLAADVARQLAATGHGGAVPSPTP